MRRKAITANVILIAFEVTAYIIRQNGGFFEYYTVDSNLIAAAASMTFVICALKDRFPKWLRTFRYMATSMLLVTMFVVLLILCPMAGAKAPMLFHDSMLFQHLLCPLLSIYSFIYLESGCYENCNGKPENCVGESMGNGERKNVGKGIEKKDNILIVVPTVIYGLVIMTLNGLYLLDGPYPFVRVHDQSVLMTVFWIVAIAIGAYLLGFVTRKWYNRRLKA